MASAKCRLPGQQPAQPGLWMPVTREHSLPVEQPAQLQMD